jgi:hypothetical protein
MNPPLTYMVAIKKRYRSFRYGKFRRVMMYATKLEHRVASREPLTVRAIEIKIADLIPEIFCRLKYAEKVRSTGRIKTPFTKAVGEERELIKRYHNG